MKILLTGATGYIGKRLLPLFVELGYEVIACVRDKSRIEIDRYPPGQVSLYKVDFLEEVDLRDAPLEFDAAFYLIHSMSSSIGNFQEKEVRSAQNFTNFLNASSAQQVIYLTGIIPEKDKLSKHLESRQNVEFVLRKGKVPLTAIRAGIVIGSGSASFEIVRDLVEKLPVMVAPRWVNSKCQPIGIRNVLQVLVGVLGEPWTYGQAYDISCGETLTYKEMMLGYANVRNLKRYIFTLPVMTPRLSSYWLYFITSTSYNLAVNLVDSMKVDVVGEPNDLFQRLHIEPIPYETAIKMAFSIIEQDTVISSWKDSYISSLQTDTLEEYIEVPSYGCFKDRKEMQLEAKEVDRVLDNIWAIGGKRGWYYGNWLWKIRGYLDKMVGGIGLRRGRTNASDIHPGDALDFWRVLVANREKGRLLLFAEMKLPGEAWLEFELQRGKDSALLKQTATFRPRGLFGRLYWFAVLPFHWFVFKGMITNIANYGRG